MSKVSIIMSVYNGEQFLAEAIESISNQSFKDFEFIIVDDCSTDSTSKILDNYIKKDPRIRIIKNNQNIGLTVSLNKALKEAAGEYIARMDCDDVALADRLEKQIEFMEKNPDTVLLGTAYYEIDKDGKELAQNQYPSTDHDLRTILIRFNPFCHASVIIRQPALLKAGLYDENISRTQDYDLWFRLANVGKIANLPEYLMKRRYNDNNISIALEDEQLKWAISIRKKAIKKGYYSPLNYLYLIRPLIALMTPFSLRKIIRKYVLNNKMYG